MPVQLRPLNITPVSAATQRANLILRHAHVSAGNFLNAFEIPRRRRRRAGGAPTDLEQDLLRAMLLFATAGLDAMVKQLIRDALPIVVDADPGAHSELEKFIHARLKLREDDSKAAATDYKFLAVLLANKSPRSGAIDELVRRLTANSLQSKDELLRAAAHFAIQPNQLTDDITAIHNIFKVRNEIAHEMDIDFDQRNRRRFPRRRDDMVEYTNHIMQASAKFLMIVDSKCPPLQR